MGSETLRSRYVMAGGVKTHYAEVGENGPVVIALHGGGAGSSGAAGAGPLMQAFPSDYRVLAPDAVGGFGLTDPSAPSPYGLQSRVDHLEDFVDALCLDRFALLGNSQGAWVAARYAMLHPEKVEKLVLIGTATISSAMGIPELHSPGMAALRGYDGTREGMRKLLDSLIVAKHKITDELIDLRYDTACRPGVMDAFRAGTKANRLLQTDPILRLQFDMTTALPALAKVIPTILMWGENDEFALPEVGRKLEKLLPEVPFHWIAKAGHQVQTDQPQQTADVIVKFLRS